MLQQSSSVARHSPQALFDRARSQLEPFAILPGNGARVSLSCFHSSASASQYSISECSISLLASAARSRHMASNAANCFSEYMGFPVVLSLIRSLSRPTDNCVMRRDLSASMFPNVVIHMTNPGALVQFVGTRIKDNLWKRRFRLHASAKGRGFASSVIVRMHLRIGRDLPVFVHLIMWTGGGYRGVRHDRHFGRFYGGDPRESN